jgi:DNA-binding response OmpR family regulator
MEVLNEQIVSKSSCYLTTKDDVSIILKGFELGTDDIITKPFRVKTLHAKMEAILRRFKDIWLDENTCTAISLET